MDNIEQNYEDFISTVSHELRTPLTSIRGFSQTIFKNLMYFCRNSSHFIGNFVDFYHLLRVPKEKFLELK